MLTIQQECEINNKVNKEKSNNAYNSTGMWN